MAGFLFKKAVNLSFGSAGFERKLGEFEKSILKTLH